jgi:hypothetical protein
MVKYAHGRHRSSKIEMWHGLRGLSNGEGYQWAGFSESRQEKNILSESRRVSMPNQILNTIGLLLNIGGVALLFRFGPPQPTFEEGVSLGLEDGTPLKDGGTVAEHNTAVRRAKRQHENWSRLALILIIIGFALQLSATWVF